MQTFFQADDKDQGSIVNRIAAACEGLIYISESDHPVIPFAGVATDQITVDSIVQQVRPEPGEPVEVRSIADFFTRLTSEKDWWGDAEKERAKKFRELEKLLEENLRSISVFRIGRIRIRIFVVGLDKDGCLTGITTEAVET